MWRGFISRRITSQELQAHRGELCLLRWSWDPLPSAEISVAGQLSLLGTGLPDWVPVPCTWCPLRQEHVLSVRPVKEVLQRSMYSPQVVKTPPSSPLLRPWSLSSLSMVTGSVTGICPLSPMDP